jgi:predicted O-methyltransferase YrrM
MTIVRSMWNSLPEDIKGFLRSKWPLTAIRRRLHEASMEGEQERVARRRQFAMKYYERPLALVDEWARKHTEDANFYYRLTPLNRLHLAHAISSVTHVPVDRVMDLFSEVEDDRSLRKHFLRETRTLGLPKDISIEYGRRIGWYAFVRILRPRVVVESGVDLGVGACILASALLRNAESGNEGRYFGTEIRSEAGQLLKDIYASVGEIIYGDSIASIKSFPRPIDVFINDSDHSPDYEYLEYLAIRDRLSSRAIVLGDNAHVTDSLSRFSRECSRDFIFFSEKPADHWYPGAGIGISFARPS